MFLAPAASVVEVRTAAGLRELPGRKDGVVGLVERDSRALTVVSTLGPRGAYVLVLNADGGTFGLLVDEVLGVVDVADSSIQPPPLGQHRSLVSGVVASGTRLELVVSVEALWRDLKA